MTLSLDLPPDMQATIRDYAKDANIAAARLYGFGGSIWDAERPSGTGTAAKVLTEIDDVHVLAFRQRPGYLAGVAGGTPALNDIWRAIVLDGDLQPGDVITSQVDDDYCFGVASIEPWYDYQRAELERRR